MNRFKTSAYCFIALLFSFCSTPKSTEQANTDTASVAPADTTEIDSIPVDISYLLEDDSIPRILIDVEKPMTETEREVHRLIWSRNEIRTSAEELLAKGVIAFTLTDNFEDKGGEADLYTIGFYQSLEEHFHRMKTFRVNLPSNTIELLNIETGEWEVINE